jgi:hypothetical protein
MQLSSFASCVCLCVRVCGLPCSDTMERMECQGIVRFVPFVNRQASPVVLREKIPTLLLRSFHTHFVKSCPRRFQKNKRNSELHCQVAAESI